MVRIAPWATVAMASFAQASVLDKLQDRGDYECCPCSEGGKPHTITITEPAHHGRTVTVTYTEPAQSVQTITVTEPAPSGKTKTIYVSEGGQYDPPTETLTITEPGKTIYVTQSEDNVITKEVTVHPVPPKSPGSQSPQTITIADEYPEPTGDGGYQVVTKTLVYGGGGGDKVETVTIEGDGGKKTITLTAPGEHVTTKTVTGHNGETSCYTVVVKPEPTVKTVTLGNGKVVTKTVTNNNYITVTSPPRVQTVTQEVKSLETVTKTVTVAGGDIEIQVIVIDPVTGVKKCHLAEEGLPCHPGSGDGGYTYPSGGYAYPSGGYANPSGYPLPVSEACESVSASTSISTVFNTVSVTVSTQMMSQNATATVSATSTTAGAAYILPKRSSRKVRGQALPKRWS